MTYAQVRQIEARKRNFEVEMLLNIYAIVTIVLLSAVIVTGWCYFVLGVYKQLFGTSACSLIMWPWLVLMIYDKKDVLASWLYDGKIQRATEQARLNREATLAKYPGLKMLKDEITSLSKELNETPSSTIARGQISLVQRELETVLEYTDEFGFQACLVDNLQDMLDRYNLSIDPNGYAKLRIAFVSYPVLQVMDTEIQELINSCVGAEHEFTKSQAQELYDEFIKHLSCTARFSGKHGISEFMLMKFNLLLLNLKTLRLATDQEKEIAAQVKGLDEANLWLRVGF